MYLQVIQENNSLQNALTQYEVVLNHETTEDEKSILKELLHRYRTVKKMMRRSSNVFTKDLELETIPECSEIQLTLASLQRRTNIKMYFFKENPDCSSKNPEISDNPENSETSENLHATNPNILDDPENLESFGRQWKINAER